MKSDAPSLRQPVEVGDVFYEAFVDMHDGSVTLDEWVITAVRGRGAYACRKTPYTWVKVSKTSGDYGWARHLGAYDRRAFPADQPPSDWAKSRAGAYSKALPGVNAAIKRLTKIRSQLLGQRTKQRKLRAKTSPGPRNDGASFQKGSPP